MQTLVQNLLDLSRAGSSDLTCSDLHLSTCVERALDALAARLEDAGGRVVVEGELPIIKGDATLLTQLYQNLIGNALKFTPRERIPEIRIGSQEGDDGHRLFVADNGIGIPQQFREEIFSPFKRLHSRDEFEGSGIGLATCRKAVTRHGGRLWVESEPGVGSTFWFTLPGVRKGLEARERDETVEAQVRSESVAG